MKYPNLRNRLDALEASSSIKVQTIRIEGGMQSDHKPAEAKPGGSDLVDQAKDMQRFKAGQKR
jgi:hypothetical protein